MSWAAWEALDEKARRNTKITVVAVAAAIIWLTWPGSASPGRSSARLRPVQTPISAAGKPGPVVHAAAPPVLPASDPLAKMLGKWGGAESLPNRGMCNLMLELRPGSDHQGFSAFSTLGCLANLPGDSKDPAGLAERVRRSINPTSASFSGAAGSDGIVLHAIDNIGVSESLQGCDMVSMTVKPFGEGRMSVRWQETGNGVCTGGEMLLARAQ